VSVIKSVFGTTHGFKNYVNELSNDEIQSITDDNVIMSSKSLYNRSNSFFVRINSKPYREIYCTIIDDYIIIVC